MVGTSLNISDFAGVDATVAGTQQGMSDDRFAAMLEDVQSKDDDEQRDAAEQLVGIALFLPLLKQARENPFKTELFHGGPGEERFAAQFDQRIADRLAERWAGPIVDQMINRMDRNG